MYTIIQMRPNTVIDYAASELKKYMRMMMFKAGEIPIKYGTSSDAGYKLGLFEDFGMDTSEVENPEYDDVIHIDTDDNGGIIAGTNPRSVLLAVYKFLQENGCRWFRPGVDGEYIPKQTVKGVKYHKKASYRHRGQCIEGAVSQQNMLDNIEWAPKVGMNAYMLEFNVPYIFYDRWYGHRDNKYKLPERITIDTAKQYKAQLEAEISKRGLIYNDMGHGWTCEPFGIEGIGWDPESIDIPADVKQYFAEVNGKRELFGDVPLNTNICMSNPEARKKVVDYMADYAESHSNVDYLHIWLADAVNNHCECENCRKMDTADHYVVLLNEMDAELTRRGLPTKLVFIAYVDLYWPPIKERFNNPSRFTLLFAPITRTYSESFALDADPNAYVPYERNKLQFPVGMAQNLTYLEKWQEVFSGDSFLYEYHFMWDHYKDPGYYEMGRILLEDIRSLKKHNINGIIEDQTQRSFLPTGFPMYLFGQAMFDSDVTFEEVAEDYFSHSFGDDWKLCMDYLAEVSRLFDPVYLRGEKGIDGRPFYNPAHVENLDMIPVVVDKFTEIIERNKHNNIRSVEVSWRYMYHHARIIKRLANALSAKAEGDDSRAYMLWEDTLDYAATHEDLFQEVFDVSTFATVMRGIFGERPSME